MDSYILRGYVRLCLVLWIFPSGNTKSSRTADLYIYFHGRIGKIRIRMCEHLKFKILTSKMTLTLETIITPQLISIKGETNRNLVKRDSIKVIKWEPDKKAKPSINISHPSSLGAHPRENSKHKWSDQFCVVLAFLALMVSTVKHFTCLECAPGETDEQFWSNEVNNDHCFREDCLPPLMCLINE